MARSVTLACGPTFPTLRAAETHFARMLNDQELGKPFSGQSLAEIREVYAGYCANTGWVLRSDPASFRPVHARGPGYTTKCFGVTFEDGTTGQFSMATALREIAVQAGTPSPADSDVGSPG